MIPCSTFLTGVVRIDSIGRVVLVVDVVVMKMIDDNRNN